MKNKNIKFLVIAILVSIVASVGLTYAYFTASVSTDGKITSNVKTSSRDVFTTSGSSTLDIEVTNTFMDEDDGEDDYSVSISKDGKITVSLTAGSGTASCYYDLAISNSGSVAYTKSPDLGGLFEYTVQGVDDGTQSFDEINVDDAIASTISATPANDSTKQVSSGILGNFFIMDSYDKDASKQSATTQEWTITTKFYNLNKLQNAQVGKTYSYNVKVVNAHCTNSWPIKPIIIGNGTLDDVGTEVAIGNEHFYVVSSDDDTVTMLAKYNLLVGYTYDSALKTITAIANTKEGYGLQSENAKGYISGASQHVGTVKFSSKGYWVDDDSELLSTYGTSYPAWVYDDNASIKDYVDNYREELNKKYNLSLKETDARLIKYEELITLGCLAKLSCDSAPSWVYNTSYWTGSAFNINCMWFVYSYGYFINTSMAKIANLGGVRPVIIFSKSNF